MPVAIRPRSISERVEALGGQFRIDSTTKGARLDIAIRTGVFA
jgi:signal transduction histidine kinase